MQAEHWFLFTMVKGEKTPESKLGSHKVDGMAGANASLLLELMTCY